MGTVIGVFLLFAAPLSIIDARSYRLPHMLTIPALIAGWILSFLGLDPGVDIRSSLLGSIAGFVVIAILAGIAPEGIGMGDAFWLAAIGAYVGLHNLPTAVLSSSLMGLLSIGILRLALKRNHRTKIPFGPFLSLGGLIAIVVRG